MKGSFNLMNTAQLRKQFTAKYEKLKSEADNLSNEEFRKVTDELKELKKRIAMEEEARDLTLPDTNNIEIPTEKVATDEPKDVRSMTDEEVDKAYTDVFLRAFRGKRLSKRDHEIFNRQKEMRDVPNTDVYLQTDNDENGGFIVPREVSTLIKEYKRELEYDLTNLVSVTQTTVISGRFTYEKLGTIQPWENISQWETIPEVNAPQFETKQYEIEDYAGILPIPNTLLQDTDQNLLQHIAKYIARKSLVTRNTAILNTINATYKKRVPIKTIDDLKDLFDFGVDAAFNATATIVTNPVGYNYLRKLKDNDGNYLLQPDVTLADRKAIDGHPVLVIPERELPSTGKKAPLFYGDFKEAIEFFDRGVYEVTPTAIGGDSFKRNSLDIRVIDRFDVVALDNEAVVAGTIDPTISDSGSDGDSGSTSGSGSASATE